MSGGANYLGRGCHLGIFGGAGIKLLLLLTIGALGGADVLELVLECL